MGRDEPGIGIWRRIAGWLGRYRAEQRALRAAGLCLMCGEEPALDAGALCLTCDGNDRAAP
jgi:hypothetical protein